MESQHFYGLVEQASFLKRVPLFHHFSPQYLARLSEITSRTRLTPGEVLFSQGDAADSLYIIRSGEVSIRIDGQQIAVLDRFDVLGELSILDESLRSATVTAITQTLLIRISSVDFKSLLSIHPHLSLILMRTLAQRLREREAGAG